MSYLWDYRESKIKKTTSGKLLILERKINFGTAPAKDKISLSGVKKNWRNLHLQPRKKGFLNF